jgi:hypothetical protein
MGHPTSAWHFFTGSHLSGEPLCRQKRGAEKLDTSCRMPY